MMPALLLWLSSWIAVLAAIAFVLRLSWRAVRALERREAGRGEIAAMQLRMDQLEATVAAQARELRRVSTAAADLEV